MATTSNRGNTQADQVFAPHAMAERSSIRELAEAHLRERGLPQSSAHIGLLLLYAGARAHELHEGPPLDMYGTDPERGKAWTRRAKDDFDGLSNFYFHVRGGKLVLLDPSGEIVDVLHVLGKERTKALTLALRKELGHKRGGLLGRFLSRTFERKEFLGL